MRRVVITGMGAVTPFGAGVEVFWRALLEGRNGIRIIEELPLSGDLVRIGGCVPRTEPGEAAAETTPDRQPPPDPTVLPFLPAVHEALSAAGLDLRRMESTERVGVYIADRVLNEFRYAEQYAPLLFPTVAEQDSELDPWRFYRSLRAHPSGRGGPWVEASSINHVVARRYGLTGPQLSISTACASSNSSIGEGFLKVRHGYLDAVIAGGAYAFDLAAMVGFSRLGALTMNPDPEIACCPFDRRRSGFVMGSGCGILILEELEQARRRGAPLLAEVAGYGFLSDAFRATDPDPEGQGAARTMNACLHMARLSPTEIDYVNAHGTSTKMNDLTETRAIKAVLGARAREIPVSSTKSMIGHAILAAGALEAIACVRSITDQVIHPTRNYQERDEELDLDYVPDGPRELPVNKVLSNSFGFGGQNACLAFARTE